MPIRPNHDPKVWCDVCKLRYGQEKGVWHDRAQTPAKWIVISETQERAGTQRAYCLPCAKEAQTWADGTLWSFKDQLAYAKEKETLNYGVEIG